MTRMSNFVLLYILPTAIILLASSTTQAGEAEDQYAVAAGHYDQKHWELASEEFTAFLDRFPRHPKAPESVYYLGEIFLQSGQLEKAQKRFDQYLREHPQGQFQRAAAFRAAETAYLCNNYPLAKRLLANFNTKYPKDHLGAFVLPYLGNIALAENDADAAADAFRAGLDQFPHGQLQDNCRLGLAQALEKQGKCQEAGQLFEALAAKPTSPLADEARYRLGLLQFTIKQYDQAAQTLRSLAARNATASKAANWQPHARLCLALALRKLGQTAEARDLLTKVASDPAIGIDARYWLAVEHKEAGRWSAAADALVQLSRECPQGHHLLAAVNFHAGDALLRDGRIDAAATHFETVLALPKANNQWADDAARAMVQIALCSKDYEKLDRRTAAFHEQFAENPLRDDVEKMRARSLIDRKQFQEAAEILAPGQDGKTISLDNRYLLALAQQGLKQHEKALETIRPVVKDAEGRLKNDALLVEASALVGLKRFIDAVQPLEDYLNAAASGADESNIDKTNAEDEIRALAQLAICHVRAGNLDEAKKRHARLLEDHVDHELFAASVAELAEVALAKGNCEWSAELFRWLVEESGREEFEIRGLGGLAWSLLENKQNEAASTAFERLLLKNPEPKLAAEAAFVRGRILESMQRQDGALAMYDRVVEQYAAEPQHPKALLAAARLRTRLSNLEEAAGLYKRLAGDYAAATNIDVVLYEWSWTLRDLDRVEESTALFERIHSEFPTSRLWADATYRLAAEAFDRSDTERAGELIERILTQDNTQGDKPAAFAHALALKWQIAAFEDRWDDVGKAARRLLDECPKSDMRLVAEYWVAESTYRRGEYDLAGKRFDELAEKAKDRTDPWLAMVDLRRSQILVHQNQWSRALALAAKIPERFPEFEQQHEVDYLLGRCFARRAEFEKARQSYLRVTRSAHGAKTETAAMAQWMIGETYFHQKDYRAAVKAYHRVEMLYAYPQWQAAALLQAAKCREQLGQTREAANLFRRVMEKYPQTTFVEEAGRRLRTMKS